MLILPSVEYNDHNPTYIYMYNGVIEELESIKHSPETIKYLNEKGVTFYLNEPLCIYLPPHLRGRTQQNNTFGEDKHTLTFYSEFNGEEDPNYLRADELNSIKKYVIKNLHGQTLQTGSLTGEIDISDLETGIYLLSLFSKKSVKSIRLIKQ